MRTLIDMIGWLAALLLWVAVCCGSIILFAASVKFAWNYLTQ